jgi:hypothetical protein
VPIRNDVENDKNEDGEAEHDDEKIETPVTPLHLRSAMASGPSRPGRRVRFSISPEGTPIPPPTKKPEPSRIPFTNYINGLPEAEYHAETARAKLAAKSPAPATPPLPAATGQKKNRDVPSPCDFYLRRHGFVIRRLEGLDMTGQPDAWWRGESRTMMADARKIVRGHIKFATRVKIYQGLHEVQDDGSSKKQDDDKPVEAKSPTAMRLRALQSTYDKLHRLERERRLRSLSNLATVSIFFTRLTSSATQLALLPALEITKAAMTMPDVQPPPLLVRKYLSYPLQVTPAAGREASQNGRERICPYHTVGRNRDRRLLDQGRTYAGPPRSYPRDETRQKGKWLQYAAKINDAERLGLIRAKAVENEVKIESKSEQR